MARRFFTPLQQGTTGFDYALLRFRDVPEPVSVSSPVKVTVQWKGKTFRNLHQYKDFKLFNTSAQEKRRAENPPSPGGPAPN